MAPPISFYPDLGDDLARSEQAFNLLFKICHQVYEVFNVSNILQSVHEKPPLTTHQWKMILQDVLTIREKVFSFIPLEHCYSLFVQQLLASGNLQLAKEYLHLIGEKAEEYVLSAAQEYFNSAVSASEPSMVTAQQVYFFFFLAHLPIV